MITRDDIESYKGKYVLFAEWDLYRRDYRVYDNIAPWQTVAYVDDANDAIQYAETHLYDGVVIDCFLDDPQRMVINTSKEKYIGGGIGNA